MTDRERRELEAELCALRLAVKELTALLEEIQGKAHARAESNYDEYMSWARKIERTLNHVSGGTVDPHMARMWDDAELEAALLHYHQQSIKALS